MKPQPATNGFRNEPYASFQVKARTWEIRIGIPGKLYKTYPFHIVSSPAKLVEKLIELTLYPDYRFTPWCFVIPFTSDLPAYYLDEEQLLKYFRTAGAYLYAEIQSSPDGSPNMLVIGHSGFRKPFKWDLNIADAEMSVQLMNWINIVLHKSPESPLVLVSQ